MSSFIQIIYKQLNKRYIYNWALSKAGYSANGGVGSLITEKKNWNYDIDISYDYVKTISISLNGTYMLLCKEGNRQSMVGSISLYYFGGERLYTL